MARNVATDSKVSTMQYWGLLLDISLWTKLSYKPSNN